MKVKELKQLLENVDDELEIVGYQYGMEQSGQIVGYQYGMELSGLLPVSKYNMKTLQGVMVKRNTWDAFDGTEYCFDVFVEKIDGNTKMFRLY